MPAATFSQEHKPFSSRPCVQSKSFWDQRPISSYRGHTVWATAHTSVPKELSEPMCSWNGRFGNRTYRGEMNPASRKWTVNQPALPLLTLLHHSCGSQWPGYLRRLDCHLLVRKILAYFCSFEHVSSFLQEEDFGAYFWCCRCRWLDRVSGLGGSGSTSV